MDKKMPAHVYLLQELRTLVRQLRAVDEDDPVAYLRFVQLRQDACFICRSLVSIHIPAKFQAGVERGLEEIYFSVLGLTDVGGFNFQHLVRETTSIIKLEGEIKDA